MKEWIPLNFFWSRKCFTHFSIKYDVICNLSLIGFIMLSTILVCLVCWFFAFIKERWTSLYVLFFSRCIKVIKDLRNISGVKIASDSSRGLEFFSRTHVRQLTTACYSSFRTSEGFFSSLWLPIYAYICEYIAIYTGR